MREQRIKRKQRGRNSTKLWFLRKKSNVVGAQRQKRLALLEKDKKERADARAGPAPPKTALDRFKRKPEW